jgi:hypothetical protein
MSNGSLIGKLREAADLFNMQVEVAASKTAIEAVLITQGRSLDNALRKAEGGLQRVTCGRENGPGRFRGCGAKAVAETLL